jgi:hypothetical protein
MLALTARGHGRQALQADRHGSGTAGRQVRQASEHGRGYSERAQQAGTAGGHGRQTRQVGRHCIQDFLYEK